MDERGAGLTEMVVYFATGNLSPSWPRSLSTNFAQDGGRVADGISGGDVYFARGGPRDPHAALPRKRAVHKTSGMTCRPWKLCAWLWISNIRRTFAPVCYRQGRKSPYVCSQPQRSVDEDPHRPVRRTGTLYNAVPCRGAGVPWAPLDFEVPSRSFFRLLNFLTGCNLKSEPQIHQLPYRLDLNETSKEPDRNLKGTSRNLKSTKCPTVWTSTKPQRNFKKPQIS